MSDPLHSRLRLVGYTEGVSFLVLLGIAMPLKYFADMPLAVKIVGLLHGLLWIWYVALIVKAHKTYGWSRAWLLGGLAASVLPFGPFVFEARLRRSCYFINSFTFASIASAQMS